MVPHEAEFIDAFLTSAYRARCRACGGIPREDFCHGLESKLDRRFVLDLPHALQTFDRMQAMLRSLDAVETGHFIGGESDGMVVRIDEWSCNRQPLVNSMTMCETIVSFLPGRLALYQAEFGDGFCCLLIRDPGLQRRAPAVLEQLMSLEGVGSLHAVNTRSRQRRSPHE